MAAHGTENLRLDLLPERRWATVSDVTVPTARRGP